MQDKALYFVFGAFVSGIITWMGSYSHFTGRLEYIRVEQQILALQSRKVISCIPVPVEIEGIVTQGVQCVEEIQPLLGPND